MDQYEILRSSTGYFLAEDGNYSGAVEQIVEELATDRVRKEFWETLQLTSLEQQLTKDNPQLGDSLSLQKRECGSPGKS